MKKLILLFAILATGVASAQEITEEYIDGRLVKHQTIDNVSVATSLRAVSRNDGKYYMFDVSITNGTDGTMTVKTSDFRAFLNTKKGLQLTHVLTRKEYLKIKKRRENLRAGLMAFAGAMNAASAGYSESNTSYSGSSNTRISGTARTNSSATAYGSNGGYVSAYGNSTTRVNGNINTSYSGSARTTSYNGAAAYAARENEAAKLNAFLDASAEARADWNDAYIKNNTLSPLESMSGFVNVKFKRSNLCVIILIVDGREFKFNWNPADAEN